ncbi:MAG: hypothetical protein JRJ12_12655 [Deltaproteobacteria bacterium]|nr:hypothetical protein [Deltaproteobacteria bacterium]MBW2072322.1 hypothetical protein [Deltaproteobacteria bacterium]
MTFPLKEISYKEFLNKIEASERRYLSDEPGFPEGARETGLRICKKLRREVEELGPENCLFYLDTTYDIPLYKPKKLEE